MTRVCDPAVIGGGSVMGGERVSSNPLLSSICAMALTDDRPPTFEEALAPLVERLVAKYIQRHVAPPGWIAHTTSPLGRTRTAALCRSGRLPGVRLQGTKLWLIRVIDLDAFIAANTSPPHRGGSAPGTEEGEVERELDRALAKAGKRRRG